MKLTLQQLEAHLWGAANILRGKTAGQDYKNYILSLMFFKRLCDQWECECKEGQHEAPRGAHYRVVIGCLGCACGLVPLVEERREGFAAHIGGRWIDRGKRKSPGKSFLTLVLETAVVASTDRPRQDYRGLHGGNRYGERNEGRQHSPGHHYELPSRNAC